MYRIIKPRGGGKTTEILHLAEETGATVVCANPRLMKKKIEAEGYNDDIQCISYADFILHDVGTTQSYLIDEVDGLLLTIHRSVIGYSLSPED